MLQFRFCRGAKYAQLGAWLLLSCWVTATLAATRFAYVASPYDYTISGYLVDDSGLLFPNGLVFTKDKYPSTIIVHPSGKFLYSASRTVDTVPIYKIDPVTGWLQETKESPFDSRLRSPFSYGFHPSGDYLYVAGRGGGVAGFSVDQNSGALNYVPGSPFRAGERTRSLSVHPSGEFVYASNAYTNNISAYRVNPKNGALVELANSPFPAGEAGPFDDTYAKLPDVGINRGGLPYYIATHPSGQYVYVTNWAAASISMFRVDQQSGDLSLIEQPKETGLTPYAVAVHPSGKYVYASTWGSNDVWAYTVDLATGLLSHIEGSPFATNGFKPVDIAFNRDGTMAYVANISSNNTTIFEVNPETGVLLFKDLAMARAGAIDVELVSMPTAVTVEPKYAFIINKQDELLISYQVNAESGDLTEISRVNTGKDPSSVSHDPKNRFVYVANAGSDNVSAYHVHHDGKMSEVTGSPYSVGKNPVQLYVDANGWYIYVLNKDSHDVSVFLIHVKEGQLAEAQGSPLNVGQQPLSINVDPHARYVFVNRAGDNALAVFRYRSAITPAIFEIAEYGSPFLFKDTPSLFAVDPTGRFAMVVSKDTGQAAMFYVQVDNGSLMPIEENLDTVNVGATPIDVVYHPKGRYVYLLDESSNNISQFRVDRLYGRLTSIGSPIGSKGRFSSLVMDPGGRFLYAVNTDGKTLVKFKIDSNKGHLSYAGDIKLAFPPGAMSLSRQLK